MSGSRPDAAALVEEGLQLYTSGRLDEALAKWNEALALDSDVPRASEYVQYVLENRTALYRSFQAAETASSEANAAIGAADVATDDVQWDDEPLESEFDAPTGRVLLTEPDDSLDWRREASPQVEAPADDPGAAEPPPLELTVRVDLEPGPPPTAPVAGGEHEQTERIDPALYRPTIAESRQRVVTPLTVVPGEGAASGGDFEPAEPTPVGMELPEPSRLVPREEEAEVLGQAEVELAMDQATPQGLGRSKRGDSPFLAHAEDSATSTRDRLNPIPDLPPPLPPPDADLSELGMEDEGASSPPMDALPSRAERAGLIAVKTADRLEPFPELVDDRPPADEGLSPLPAVGGAPPGEPSAAAAPAPGAKIGELGGELGDDDNADAMMVGAWQLYEQGTHEGSLWLCQRILAIEPDRKEAQSLLDRNRGALLHQYEELLEDLEATPMVKIPPDQIVWHKLDHRAGFLLSRIDGTLTYCDLLDVSGMDRFETFRILAQLLEQGVIGVGP